MQNIEGRVNTNFRQTPANNRYEIREDLLLSWDQNQTKEDSNYKREVRKV